MSSDIKNSGGPLLPFKFDGNRARFQHFKQQMLLYFAATKDSESLQELLDVAPDEASAIASPHMYRRPTPPNNTKNPEKYFQSTTQTRAAVINALLRVLPDETSNHLLQMFSNELHKEDIARRFWDELNNYYSNITQAMLDTLERNLENLKMSENEKMDKYLSRADDLCYQIRGSGRTVENDRLIQKILNGLPSQYYLRKEQILSEPTSYEEKELDLTEEERVKYRFQASMARLIHVKQRLRDRYDEIQNSQHAADNLPALNVHSSNMSKHYHSFSHKNNGRSKSFKRKFPNEQSRNTRQDSFSSEQSRDTRLDSFSNEQSRNTRQDTSSKLFGQCKFCLATPSNHRHSECKSAPICAVCNKPGHIARECRNLNKSNQGGPPNKIEKPRK